MNVIAKLIKTDKKLRKLYSQSQIDSVVDNFDDKRRLTQEEPLEYLLWKLAEECAELNKEIICSEKTKPDRYPDLRLNGPIMSEIADILNTLSILLYDEDWSRLAEYCYVKRTRFSSVATLIKED